MARQAASLNDVAKLSGVSKSTVSRILSSKPGELIPFAPETQARVREATERLGYRPSRIALGLHKARTGIVGLVIPSIQDSFFPGLTNAIEDYLAREGYSVLLANTHGSAATEKEKIDELLAWRVDGLIIAPTQQTTDSRLFWDLWRQQIPFVLVDRVFTDTPFASVITDDAAGTRYAVEHLVQRGAQRIACAGGPMGISTNRVRAESFREAMIQNGLLPRKEYEIDVPSTIEGGREAIRRLMQLNERPDALFCFSDLLAAGAMAEALAQGLHIPEDLALVGYADLELSELLRVPLTTIQQPRDLLGKTTAEMLMERMTHHADPADHKVLPVKLIQRESA